MPKVKALVLRTAGTNCDLETEYAFKQAGAETHRIHINRVLEKKDLLHSYHILVLPGGFTYGDDIAAGKILANLLRFHLEESIRKFLQDGKLVIGICNGFQALVKSRLLPALDGSNNAQEATLTFNDSNRFEARWVHLKVCSGKSVYVDEGQLLYMPVAHAEGKFVTRDNEVLDRLRDSSQILFKYVNERGESAGYPYNPNGSVDGIAGVCDPTGRILGMMPHPERYVEPLQHPHWQRGGLDTEPHGMQIFRNAVKYVGKNLL
ncbi:MAG TPA: phosphoribosylformylglycinamidine synthase I [Candidatus Avalokitesvara rifleensis]|uniref:phosphoribosylformylglycinamidine synthase I n=1 Tax=Candidatus Avalokitesvara rifleensis TaxID=3367620 RepID=UPI002712EEE5|nr:phosphoribosylformylglycinamidine synthase I [Candidatus Brocadiales bacterium]